MFAYDEEAQRWSAVHHPFTAPKDGHEIGWIPTPRVAKAKAYDMVLNGWELGGRLGAYPPRRGTAKRCLRRSRLAPKKRNKVWFSCSTPCATARRRHGGVAFGLNRLVTLMTEGRVDS